MDSRENSFHFFPLWKRGMKWDLTVFQKAKLLRNLARTLIGQPVSEIPLNPPLEKGGRGDFRQVRRPRENMISWVRLCQFINNS